MTDQLDFSPQAFMAAASAPAPLSGNTDWAHRYAETIRQVVKRHAGTHGRSQQRHLGPSEIGHVCHRQVVGKLIGLPRTNHVLDPWPSILGTAAHAWLEVAFRDENGRLGYLRWIPEQKVEPFPGDTPFETHRGTADLYDAVEQCVGDHKVLGPTSLNKVRTDKVPRYYVVQALLYKRGYERLGLPVRRVALIAYPRAAASLDQLYVWERPASLADDELIDEVVRELAYRKQWAAAILAGQANWHDVPEDTNDECAFCPFYRPQTAHDGGPGCPGHAVGRP